MPAYLLQDLADEIPDGDRSHRIGERTRPSIVPGVVGRKWRRIDPSPHERMRWENRASMDRFLGSLRARSLLAEMK
jgi:hypothetical protein